MDHVRIDEGIKRGPRKQRIKPSQIEREVRQRARNNLGKFLPIHTKEQRQAVVADALQLLEAGLTTDDIGRKHGVTGEAVRTWLVAAKEDAADARTLFFSRIQVQLADEIQLAQDPLALARAREGFSAWHKLAQVRDPRNFGPKQEVTHVGNPTLNINVSHAVPQLEHTINTDSTQVIDSTDV